MCDRYEAMNARTVRPRLMTNRDSLFSSVGKTDGFLLPSAAGTSARLFARGLIRSVYVRGLFEYPCGEEKDDRQRVETRRNVR